MFDVPKLVLIGTLEHEEQNEKCMMILNLNNHRIEKLKILELAQKQQINCIQYGPYDNGHIMLGLSDGWMLGFEYPSLKRVESKQVFKLDQVMNFANNLAQLRSAEKVDLEMI